MRGRPPKPTRLKILQGNPGRRPLPANEPKPPPRTRVPTPPENMGKHAKREWRRVAKVLVAQGLLTDLDMTMFRAYCHAYDRWYEAEAAILAMGVMLKSAKTGGIYQNPYLPISKQWLAIMERLGGKFGMSPADRARVGVVGDPDADDPVGRFLFGNQPKID